MNRDKGLYFQCEEKFVLGHECNKRQLFLLTMESDENEESERCGEWETKEQHGIDNLVSPQLFFHALTGACSFHTT